MIEPSEIPVLSNNACLLKSLVKKKFVVEPLRNLKAESDLKVTQMFVR